MFFIIDNIYKTNWIYQNQETETDMLILAKLQIANFGFARFSSSLLALQDLALGSVLFVVCPWTPQSVTVAPSICVFHGLASFE